MMYNLMTTKKIMSYFLPIINIDKIDLCVVSIKEYFIYPGVHLSYFVYLYFIFHLGQRYFNRPRGILNVKRLAIDLPIILYKSMMTEKKSWAIVTLSIKLNQVISRIYNIGLLSMKVLIIINT